MSVSQCKSVVPYLSVSLRVYLYGFFPISSISLSVSPSVCSSLRFSVPPSLCLCISIFLSLHLSVFLCYTLCLSVFLSFWPVYPSSFAFSICLIVKFVVFHKTYYKFLIIVLILDGTMHIVYDNIISKLKHILNLSVRVKQLKNTIVISVFTDCMCALLFLASLSSMVLCLLPE